MSRYTPVKAHWKLGLILLVYVILATAYSVVVPIGRGADEWAHYWYARFIAENGRLPASPAEREAAGYKSDWPPLYHLAAAGLTFWIDTGGPPTFKYRADTIRRQLVTAQGPEAILHTEDERFPWQQEILVWHLGRFLSIAFSLGTLVVTYLAAFEWFKGVRDNRSGSRRAKSSRPSDSTPNTSATLDSQSPNLQSLITNYQLLSLLTVALLAFNPRFLFTGMLFNYDSLTLLLATIFLWLSIRIAKEYPIKRGFLALGAIAGLALITKYLAALLPLIIIFLVFTKPTSQGQTLQPETRRSAPPTLFTAHVLRVASYLFQALLAFSLVTSWWFAYLIISFNEIDTYGPVLGTLAPLIRGDGSDRTVEGIFVWLSGGQAPAPDYIERQSYNAWQIISELPLTFWGNPIVRPYPLDWFVIVMSILTLAAAVGIVIAWRKSAAQRRRLLNLLLLFCALPLPFMLIRLFGARDVLEAMQGRHVLFLSGPAFAILFVYGTATLMNSTRYALRITNHTLGRSAYRVVVIFLLIGAVAQLIFMTQTYPPLLPVRTTPLPTTQLDKLDQEILLDNGAKLVGYRIANESRQSLHIELIWQGGSDWAAQDYQTELALIDAQGQTQATWRAYQTQARYPTRAWEAGDTIRDDGWLPLVGLPAGDYQIQLRILGESGPVTDWRTLGRYTLGQTGPPPTTNAAWLLWHNGQITTRPPLLHERETVQLTPANPQSPHPQSPHLQSPIPHLQFPISPTFTIPPQWPTGDYALASDPQNPIFRVAESRRNFALPDISHPLDVNFAGKIKLLGYDLPARRVEPGSGLPVTLYWQGLTWMGEEFVIFNRLLDNQQLAWGGYDRMAQENYSTLLWAPQEIIVDGFAVPVAPDAPDGVYMLRLGWYQVVEDGSRSLPILQPDTGEATGETAVTIGPIKVGGPPAEATIEQAEPQFEVNVILGDKIRLLGVDQNFRESCNSAPLSNCSLSLTFYWEPVAQIDIDYTLFVHVRTEAAEIVVQNDRPPLGGAYPTRLWDEGEIIRDELSIPLEQIEPGRYEIVVGMYDPITGVRLPVDGSPDDSVTLKEFEVVAK